MCESVRDWASLGESGRLWVTLCDSGRVWVTLGESRQALGESGRVWASLGESGRVWPNLAKCELAFTSTSASGCIITRPELQAGAWGKVDTPLVLIDISVPRNVESQCNDVGGVKAYNVDDLKQVVAANQAKRRHKVVEAEVLLRVELAKFVQWQESLRYVPAIAKLQKKFEAIRQAEIAKASRKGLKGMSDKERQAVDIATKGIINKLLHGPMSYLRSDDQDGSKATVQQINELFMLDED